MHIIFLIQLTSAFTALKMCSLLIFPQTDKIKKHLNKRKGTLIHCVVAKDTLSPIQTPNLQDRTVLKILFKTSTPASWFSPISWVTIQPCDRVSCTERLRGWCAFYTQSYSGIPPHKESHSQIDVQVLMRTT